MEIHQVSIEVINPYEKNPRKNDDAVNVVAKSLEEFGFQQPVVLDGNNVIVVGHTRFRAAKKIGLKTVPCIIAEGLTDEQINAYRIMDNKSAEYASWHVGLLVQEMTSLLDADYDLDLTGFSNLELKDLGLDVDLGFVEEGYTDEDDVPDLPDEPTAKLGDVWQLGSHRLMCGDSTDIDAVGTLMDGQKADMVFTDPPYGVSYQSNVKKEKFDVLINDDKFLDISPVIEASSEGWVFVWTSWKVVDKWIDVFKSFGYPSNIIVWHKKGGGIGDLKKTFSTDYEIALVWHRGAELTGKRIGSVWSIGKDGSSTYVHPTQKPVALGEEAIDKTTRHGDKILDLFGGSGSTMIACEKTGRINYSMELNPKYCDVIVKRWERFTKKTAQLQIVTENGE